MRVEANVYNYSTAVEINNLKVRFDVINYDSDSTRDQVHLVPRRRNSPAADGPLHGRRSVRRPARPAPDGARRVTWDTTGFGPAVAGQSSDYRVYVVLDPENAIDETYETEDPNTDYKCVDGNGNPARCRRALTRGRTTKVSATPP